MFNLNFSFLGPRSGPTDTGKDIGPRSGPICRPLRGLDTRWGRPRSGLPIGPLRGPKLNTLPHRDDVVQLLLHTTAEMDFDYSKSYKPRFWHCSRLDKMGSLLRNNVDKELEHNLSAVNRVGLLTECTKHPME